MARFELSEYRPVQERINDFLAQHEGGRILTNLMSLPDDYDTIVFKAEVYADRDDPRPVATGWSIEVAGKSDRDGANFGSHLENAETSAIGRALANFGYAKNAQDRPSREEMVKVNAYPQSTRAITNYQKPIPTQQYGNEQRQPTPGTDITPPQSKLIHQIADEKGILDSIDWWANEWYGSNVESLSRRDASAMIDKLRDFVAQNNDGGNGPVPFDQGASAPAPSPINRDLVQPGSAAESGMNEGAQKFWLAKIADAENSHDIQEIERAMMDRFGNWPDSIERALGMKRV